MRSSTKVRAEDTDFFRIDARDWHVDLPEIFSEYKSACFCRYAGLKKRTHLVFIFVLCQPSKDGQEVQEGRHQGQGRC